jgi:hypothetical protein
MNHPEFQVSWRAVTLNERQSALPHLESVCAPAGISTVQSLLATIEFFGHETTGFSASMAAEHVD